MEYVLSKHVQKFLSRQPRLLNDCGNRAAWQIAIMLRYCCMSAGAFIEELIMTPDDPYDDESASLKRRYNLAGL